MRTKRTAPRAISPVVALATGFGFFIAAVLVTAALSPNPLDNLCPGCPDADETKRS